MIYEPKVIVEKLRNSELPRYRVVKTIATVKPRVGEILSEPALHSLIDPVGWHVTIKEERK